MNKTTIHYLSDAHLEFAPCELPGGDVLILAGDICEIRSLKKDFHATKTLPYVPGSHRYYDFFYHECAKYERVFYVAGNHEFYHGRYDKAVADLRSMLPSNITVLDKEFVEYDGIVFGGATMWTNANNMDSLTVYTLKYGMNDYRYIQNYYAPTELYYKLTPEVTISEHVKTVNFFRAELPKYADKAVIMVTHHAPSFKSVSPEYVDEFHLNGGYASDLSEFLLDHPQIKAHIHGHIHHRNNYTIGDTTILSAPRGYKGHERCAEDFKVGVINVIDGVITIPLDE